MSIIYRSVKGSKLTSDEVDGNFRFLENQVAGGDRFTAFTGFSLAGQNLTLNASSSWVIDTVAHTNASSVVINIPYAASGMERIDLIVANASNTFVRVGGVESASNPVAPVIPANTVMATFVSVTDGTVGTGTTPIVGNEYVNKNEFYEVQVADAGDIAITLDTESTAFRLTGAVTSVTGFEMTSDFISQNLYVGKEIKLVNSTGADIPVLHNGATTYPARFPSEVDFVWKNNEVIFFKPVKTDTLHLEFCGVGRDASVNEHFKGKYTSEASLISAHPTASDGDYAIVDPGSGSEAVGYIWDAEEGWVAGSSPVALGVTTAVTNITSSNLATQDVAGFVSYINSVASFAVAANERRIFHVDGIGKYFELIPNNRSFGTGQPAITSADVKYQDVVVLNTPQLAAETIVFRGDSLMTGFGITATDRWPKVLCDSMGYTESNLAVNGSSVKTTPLSSTPTKTSSMKYLFVGYGTNDRAIGGNTAAIFETDLTTFVNDAISKGWPAGKIILVSMPGFQYQSGGSVASITSYNTAISNVATALGCVYVDLWNSMVTDTPFGSVTNLYLTTDGTHPTKIGCLAMAKIIMPNVDYHFNLTGQKMVVNGNVSMTDVKFLDFAYSALGSLLGVKENGDLCRLLGLPDKTIVQGEMFVNKGIKQTTAFVPSAVTDLDVVLKNAARIIVASDNSNYAEIQPFDVNGHMNFRNRFNSGDINFYVANSQLLAFIIQRTTGIVKATYGVTLPYGTAVFDQSASATLYGKLNLYDANGDTILRNSFSTGKYKTFVSGGTNGNQVQVKQTFASGREQLQEGGTFTDITSARLAVNSTTEGFLPPRMTTTQKNAISTPALGLMVFDTTLAKLCVYTGSAWETITSS